MSARISRTAVSRAGLLLIGLLALFWATRPRRADDAAPVARQPVQAPSSFGPAAKFVFAAPSESLVAVREGDEYWIVHPFRDRADPLFFEEARRQAMTLAALRVLPDRPDGAFGLAPPRHRVTIVDRGGAEWTLWLGDPTPVGGQVYGTTDPAAGPVVVLDEFAVRKYFTPQVESLRDPVAVPLRSGPPDSIAVLAGEHSLRARRVRTDLWAARQPAGLELDPVHVNQIVQHLRGPNLAGFPAAPADDGALGLAPPRVVWVVYQSGRAETLEVGRLTPDQRGVYVRPSRRDRPAILASDFYRQLVDGWPALAERRLLRLSAAEIDTIRFLAPDGAGEYLRTQGGWIRHPGGAPVDPGRWERDLAFLTALQWVRWPSSGNRPPEPSLILRLAGAERAETVSLAAGDSLAWARRGRRPEWGPVPPAAWQAWSYRARQGL